MELDVTIIPSFAYFNILYQSVFSDVTIYRYLRYFSTFLITQKNPQTDYKAVFEISIHQQVKWNSK